MQNFVKLWIGLGVIWLHVLGAMYLICNDSIDEVESVNLTQLFQSGLRLDERMVGREAEDRNQASINKFLERAAAEGVDVTSSVYDLLADNPNIKNLSTRVAKEVDSSDGKLQWVIMSLQTEGLEFSFEFLAVDKTFLAPWQAETLGLSAVKVAKRNRLNGQLSSVSIDKVERVLMTLTSLASNGLVPITAGVSSQTLRYLAQ